MGLFGPLLLILEWVWNLPDRMQMLEHTWYPSIGRFCKLQMPVGCFTKVSRALPNIISKFVYCRNRTSYENFKMKFCACTRKLCFGHRYKVWIWNSHIKCGFGHCIFSRYYFGELAKRQWNNPLVPQRRQGISMTHDDYCDYHGGPSEAGDCSHPPPKMATVKNASSCKATFDHVIGIGSLRFLACEQVLDIANPWYSNERSSRDSLASRGTRIFQREAGDSMARDRRRRVTHGWEAGDSYFRFNFCELLFRCHTQY